MSLFLWTLVHEHAHQDGKAEETGTPKDELCKQTYKCQLAGHSSVSDVASQGMLLHSAQTRTTDMLHNRDHNKCNIHVTTAERKDTWPATICKRSIQWPTSWMQKMNH
jgi:hypothetical protein